MAETDEIQTSSSDHQTSAAPSQPEQVEQHAAEQSDTTQAKADVEAKSGQSDAEESETGEVEDDGQPQLPQDHYRWCKCFFEPEQLSAQNYYFMHFDTRETQYEEPTEPYWIWDALLNNVHESGLQHPRRIQQGPAAAAAADSSSPEKPREFAADYRGYNPKIHGSYDPNAPYAQYHKQKEAEEQALQSYNTAAAAGQQYGAVGAFNRFSGGFQTADKSTDKHNDHNKSGRQMNAFFDVDAAANMHGGKSLKEERRTAQLSKKEIAKMNKDRREKKEKKRMDFYKS